MTSRRRTLAGLSPSLLILLAGAAAADMASPTLPREQPTVAIIIDDLGYREIDGSRALALPGQITVSILPHTPFAREFAEDAYARGIEVMLHLPLEPADGLYDPDPGEIWLDTGSREFLSTLDADLASVPHAVGVNNHKGSLLTRHPGHMTWLMLALERRQLFFVDSFTTARSVALQMAHEIGVPAVRRNVFLDTDPDPAAVSMEFDRLLALARKQGYAVAIGHPYPSTLAMLERRLPELERAGVRLVSASQLIDLAYGGDQ
ncbi:MAG: divergent polysaccharide deacetylase family protein [Gammaproteobacteria bacterium]|nr:divergent polysaccharide deacetylase family protein [Gammaproteobacteria bacterium]